MESGELKEGQTNHPRPRGPIGWWRVLLIGLIAIRAFGPHGNSEDQGRVVDVTDYRICIMRACNRTEVEWAGRDRVRIERAGH
jgi:hypothetical protein